MRRQRACDARAASDHCSGVSVKRWASTLPHAPIWTRLLVPDPTWSAPRPQRVHLVTWTLWPDGGCFGKVAFGDGSLFYGQVKRLARGGWGLLVFDGALMQQAALHGPLPGSQQDIMLAAERRAVLHGLQLVGQYVAQLASQVLRRLLGVLRHLARDLGQAR